MGLVSFPVRPYRWRAPINAIISSGAGTDLLRLHSSFRLGLLMLARELRQLYIEFFKQKEHLHVPGAPLIPIDILGREDTSTLFTSAGMQQFKPYFTGEAAPPSGRVVTIQKCMRT